MKNKVCLFLSLIILFSAGNISCNVSRKTKGAIIGSTIGGAAGAILTKKNKAVGIILGAAIGGVAGGLIGAYMDKQARDIADDLGDYATVTRVGEGIVVSFDSGLLFDFDSYELRPATRENLQKLSGSLKKYEDTEVNVLGHTDSTGPSSYNKTLSRNRAGSVKTYIASQEVDSERIITEGYGESDPVADNATAEGRQLNRRVEIVIVADEDLKQAAREGTLN